MMVNEMSQNHNNDSAATPTQAELGSSLFNHPSIIVNDEVMMVGDGGVSSSRCSNSP